MAGADTNTRLPVLTGIAFGAPLGGFNLPEILDAKPHRRSHRNTEVSDGHAATVGFLEMDVDAFIRRESDLVRTAFFAELEQAPLLTQTSVWLEAPEYFKPPKQKNPLAYNLAAAQLPSRTEMVEMARLFGVIARLAPELIGNPFALFQLQSTVLNVKKWMSELGEKGRVNFDEYRKIADTFRSPGERIQFLSLMPNDYADILRYSRYPDALFLELGISKKDFLDFLGFAALSRLQQFTNTAAQVEAAEVEATAAGDTNMAQALKRLLNDTKKRIRDPKIFLSERIKTSAAMLKKLMAANTSLNVTFSLEHPMFIWVNRTPAPSRFKPNNTGFGKWVINSATPEESLAIALKLLPDFSKGDLGTLKFELQKGDNGFSKIIVYAQDKDQTVFRIVKRAAGYKPFWVTDEFCYEADAIGKLMELVVSKIDPTKEWNPILAEKLRDKEFCRSRGISEIQAEIMWRLLHHDEYPDHNTDYGHVIDGYFGGYKTLSDDLGIENNDVDRIKLLKLVLMYIAEDKNRDMARKFLEGERKKFLDIYSGKN